MTEILSQTLRPSDSWNAVPSRGAGLYGELQPLPLRTAAPVSSAMTRKPQPNGALTD